MENASNPMPMLRALKARGESRTLLLATLTEAVALWKQTSSLAAYHVIVSTLDSSDGEVRGLAEESLNRSSPRPTNHKTNSRVRRWHATGTQEVSVTAEVRYA
jgi:hypothetical protein